MKPRTKIQKEVERLRVTLPELTDAQKRYAYKHCFTHGGWLRRDGNVMCTECGHLFKPDKLTKKIEAVCPHCGTRLRVDHSKKMKDVKTETFLIMTVCGGFQVLRFFIADRRCRAGHECAYGIYEAIQHWIDRRGRTVFVARPLSYTYYHYTISSSRPMEIRGTRGHENMYNLGASAVYCRRKYLPELIRNGFKGDFHGCYPLDIVTALLSDPMAETLIKAKQTALLAWYLSSSHNFLKPYWSSVRICIRNGYTITKPQEWVDMVQAMIELGYDVRNPHYVCPSDLHGMHQRFMRLKREHRERIEAEDKRKKFAVLDAEYLARKGRLLGLCITDGELELKPLQIVAEFEAEGDAMHHCVYDMEYYKKANSLILSARIGGKRIETVEVSLNTFKVLQSRGVCNQNTEYHKRIVELVESNSAQIRKLMPRRKAKNKERGAA